MTQFDTNNTGLIYNVTIQVPHILKSDWVLWMKQKHIPNIMESGCFTHYQFTQLLEIDEAESVTYAIQYYATTKTNYDTYIQTHAPALRQEVIEKWGNNIVLFRSLMAIMK